MIFFNYIQIGKDIYQPAGSIEFWLYADFSITSSNNPRIGFKECYFYLNDGKPSFRDPYGRFTKLIDENLTNQWVNYQFRANSPDFVDIYINYVFTKSVRIKNLDHISFSLYADGINNLNIYIDFLKPNKSVIEKSIFSEWSIKHQDNLMGFNIVDYYGHADVVKLNSSSNSTLGDYIEISRDIFQQNGAIEFWMYTDFSDASINNPRVELKGCYLYYIDGKPRFRDIDAVFSKLLEENIVNRWVKFKFQWNSSSEMDIYIDGVFMKTVNIQEIIYINFVLYADGTNNLNFYIDYID